MFSTIPLVQLFFEPLIYYPIKSIVRFVIGYANYDPYNLLFWQSMTKSLEYIECPGIHSTKDYIEKKSTIIFELLKNFCKKRSMYEYGLATYL